jgi:hypothetical protein
MDDVIECDKFERLELEDLSCHVEKERAGRERHYIGKFDRGNEKTLSRQRQGLWVTCFTSQLGRRIPS